MERNKFAAALVTIFLVTRISRNKNIFLFGRMGLRHSFDAYVWLKRTYLLECKYISFASISELFFCDII